MDVLVGGQYGSEGKGNIVGHIAPEYSLLVRVGGPNAGHKCIASRNPRPISTSRPERSAHPRRSCFWEPEPFYTPKLLLEIGSTTYRCRPSLDPHAMIIEDGDIEQEKAMLDTISSTAQASERRARARSWAAVERPTRGYGLRRTVQN